MTPEELASIRESREKLVFDIKKIEANHNLQMAIKREVLKAYDVVLEHEESNGASPKTISPIPATERLRVYSPGSYGYNTVVVQRVIQEHLGDPFTVRDVLNKLNDENIQLDVTSVSTVINRLREAENPIIRVRTQGRGRRPTIYERI